MEKKKTKNNVYSLSGGRVNKILEWENISQAELCRRIPADSETGYLDRTYLNTVIHGGRTLSKQLAQKIVDAFPGRGYSVSWLLGYSDHPTAKAQREAAFSILEKDVDLAFQEQRTICDSVAAMMRIYGIDWDGISFRHTREKTAAAFSGAEFTSGELAAIANKIYKFLCVELDFAVELKKQK